MNRLYYAVNHCGLILERGAPQNVQFVNFIEHSHIKYRLDGKIHGPWKYTFLVKYTDRAENIRLSAENIRSTVENIRSKAEIIRSHFLKKFQLKIYGL